MTMDILVRNLALDESIAMLISVSSQISLLVQVVEEWLLVSGYALVIVVVF